MYRGALRLFCMGVVMVMSAGASPLVHGSEIKGKILCFGDSITAAKDSWADRLGAKSQKIRIFKAGRNGRKTSDSENELPPVLALYPDTEVVLFFLGVNDLWRDDINLVVKNMSWMIDQVKARIPKVRVVVLAPVNVSLLMMSEKAKKRDHSKKMVKALALLSQRYKVLAQEKGVGFINLYDVVSPKNFLDGVHPNQAGQQQIADAVWKGLVAGQ